MEDSLLRDCQILRPIGRDRLAEGAMEHRHLALELQAHSLTSMLRTSPRSPWSTTRVLRRDVVLRLQGDAVAHGELDMLHGGPLEAAAVPQPDEELVLRERLQQAGEDGETGRRFVSP